MSLQYRLPQGIPLCPYGIAFRMGNGLRYCLPYHARVQEGVAKSQFPLKGSGFQKSKPHMCEVLKDFTPSTTLVW
jgi:hypothetical protein